MRLFNIINHQQDCGKIKIQKEILKTNPDWKKHFEEIESINHQDLKVNLYYHSYIDFQKIFKNLEFSYFLLEKEKKKNLTTKKYIEERYLADTKILENILFSKFSHDDHTAKFNTDLPISHFPKDFENIADDLIYTYEREEERAVDYIFIMHEINSYKYNKKDYFYSLYKFLKEEIYILFNELEKSHKAAEEKLLSDNKFSNFINEVEVFKANKLSNFEINTAKNRNHDYNYFLEYINFTEIKFNSDELTKYSIVSYFTEDEIITYLQNSFKNFKKKYIYATISDYFEKNEDFKFLADRIKEIDYNILGNNIYEDFYSFRSKDKFHSYGTYKNHLVYYYNKTLYFFDLKYFDSDNIYMHFKHMKKVIDIESKNLLQRLTNVYKEDGLEKKIILEIDPQSSKSTSIEKNTSLQKIKIKGSLQSIGFLFSELIEKGFIEAPKRNGKNNTSAISRMILDHFEFIDKEEQPKTEDIRKTLFTENKLSTEKQNQFKIPQSRIINTD